MEFTDAQIRRLIDSNPYDSACFEVESNRNPLAKNPYSSASGAFQLTKATARSLGVRNVFDFWENYQGFKKLTAANRVQIDSNDPYDLYSAHYLGAPLFLRWQARETLSLRDLDHVEYLRDHALPKFKIAYQRVLREMDHVSS